MEYAGGSTVAVAAASTEVLPRRIRSGFRPARIAFSISNYGGVAVYLNLSNTQEAAAGIGVLLQPGGTFIDSNDGAYECWQGTITAFEAGGAGTLAVWERVR